MEQGADPARLISVALQAVDKVGVTGYCGCYSNEYKWQQSNKMVPQMAGEDVNQSFAVVAPGVAQSRWNV